MKRIAIFASGSGTNAENIANFFMGDPLVEVSLILSNRADAFVLERARKLGIPALTFDRQGFYETGIVLKRLVDEQIDLVVLAGFLWLVPGDILEAFNGRIINIHPALLPKFGGKGMYGDRVHEAVIAAGEKRTGISIHYVNERYDEGQIIFQESFEITTDDDARSIAKKVHQLEYEHFPKVIRDLLT